MVVEKGMEHKGGQRKLHNAGIVAPAVDKKAHLEQQQGRIQATHS